MGRPLFVLKRMSLRAIFLVVLSLLLMIFSSLGFINTNTRFGLPLKASVASVANMPRRWFDVWHMQILGKTQLVRDNETLRAQNTLLQAKLQFLLNKSSENKMLRGLLSSSARLNGAFIMADLIGIPHTSYPQTWILNRGTHSSVYVGQPAVDAHGIVGQITAVSKHHSVLTLLTNPKIAIPILTPDGYRAVAIGQKSGECMMLKNVLTTASIHLGDVIRASGLGLVFPTGYPVGKVVRIHDLPGEGLRQVWVKPSAHIHRINAMLLYWPTRH